MSLATVGFEDHTFSCIMGCFPEERIRERPLMVNLTVQVDVSKCAKSDDLNDAINYVELIDLCTQIGQQGKFNLLEAYAQAVLDRVMQEFDVESAKVRVKKPHAVPSIKWSMVEMERKR